MDNIMSDIAKHTPRKLAKDLVIVRTPLIQAEREAVSKNEAIRYMIRRGVLRTYAEASDAGVLAHLSVPGLAYNMTTMARVEKLITDAETVVGN